MYRYLIPLSTCFLLLFSGCTPQEEKIEKKEEAKVVKILSLKEQNTPQNWYEFPAEIYPYHNVDMAFEVSGKIISMDYNRADRVKKGDLIAQLDDTIYKANYLIASANYEKAHKDFLRSQQLFQKKTISKTNFEAAKQLKSVREAEFEIAKKNLDNTKLIAEFDGVIAKKYVEDFARITAKQPILTLQDNRKLKVKFFIPESDMLQVSQELDLKSISEKVDFFVNVGNLEQHRYRAKLLDVSTKAEDITRTFEVTLLMQNPKTENILPGMSARVHASLKLAHKTKSIFIPMKALFSGSSKKSMVWILTKENKVAKRAVQTGRIQKDRVEVLEGLKGDERIVTSGVNELFEGDSVIRYKKLDK